MYQCKKVWDHHFEVLVVAWISVSVHVATCRVAQVKMFASVNKSCRARQP